MENAGIERGNLIGADAKLAWAGDELEALAEEVVAWGEDRRNGYTTSSDFYSEADVNVVATRAHFARPPLDFSVRAGNIVHCCRSALDYLVSDLAILNGNEPGEGPEGNQFPILSERPTSRKGNPIDFATKTSGSLQGLRKGHIKMIERLQPFRRNNRIKGTDNALELLAQLSNSDKHRVLHVLMIGLQRGKQIEVQLTPGKDVAKVHQVHAIMVGPHLKDGAVLACTEILPGGPNPGMNFDALIPCQLLVENGMPLLPALGVIYDSVVSIIDWFRPVFAGERPGERPGIHRVPYNR
jgi:hypothetical protein